MGTCYKTLTIYEEPMSENKLVETIRLVVRNEIQKTLKPLLKEVLKPLVKEMVEVRVNAILAEKFVQTIQGDQSVMKEHKMALTQTPPTTNLKKQIAEDRRKELMKKLGVDQDPMSQLIYGDIDVNQHVAPPGMAGRSVLGANATVLRNGQIYDPEADDEGIDISGFLK